MRLSPTLAGLGTYPFVRLTEAKRRLAADGVEVIDLGVGEPREDDVGVLDQRAAGLGEPDAPRRPLDERRPRLALERRDLLRDRGLRVPEPRRGRAERALARDRLEREQVPNRQRRPSIRIHDRIEP